MIWSYAVMVLAFLVVTVIGELLPFMKDLEAAINQSRRVYVGSAIAVLVVGFTAFMGGVIYGAVRGVRSRGPRDPIPERLFTDPSAAEADPAADSSPSLPGSSMSAWRGRYVIRGRRQIAGGGFNIEVSFREMKEAWRSGAWLADPWWRFVFYMAAAATVMIVGLFGLFFMIGFAGLRLVVAGALLYAVARTWWGFMIA
jgi:hypothetical protein